MACRDDGPRYEYVPIGTTDALKDRDAMLCAILSRLEKDNTFSSVVHAANWKEAGVTLTSLLAWYERHKAADKVRKIKEAADRETDNTRKAALNKLTPEERKLLGIK